MSAKLPERAVYRGRFAPSPTGPLHLGSLTAALGSWLIARHHGGEWLIRVEDLDPPREAPGMAHQQLAALAAFALESDLEVVWQSERTDLYAEALRKLLDRELAFECRCSRSDLSASAGIHRKCVAQPSGKQAAYRLRVPARTLVFDDAIRGRFVQELGEDVGDVVVKRADGYWAYQLAVVVDDALQGITDVVRGADLMDSTPRQILLQQMLGYATPGYAHLPVIKTANGLKLSKSLRSAPIDPADPLPALRLAYAWLGQDVRALEGSAGAGDALRRALSAFQPDRIPASDRVLPAD
ncbi:MAG: tRNA glutamyl-Q(34) synthetase GluQRS [Arenimonas sp.]|jgi:glutamyl-Q tRNA(Asp) synthetase